MSGNGVIRLPPSNFARFEKPIRLIKSCECFGPNQPVFPPDKHFLRLSYTPEAWVASHDSKFAHKNQIVRSNPPKKMLNQLEIGMFGINVPMPT